MTGNGSWAEISACGTWRYGLGRAWDPALPVLGWLMLNPSAADAKVNDMTIGKVVTISGRAGFGGAWVANLYGYRSPSPAWLRETAAFDAEYATGPDNDAWIWRMLDTVPRVVLAWGAHGGEKWAAARRDAVLRMVTASGVAISCLGTTNGGEPRHPCRLPYATPLEALP